MILSSRSDIGRVLPLLGQSRQFGLPRSGNSADRRIVVRLSATADVLYGSQLPCPFPGRWGCANAFGGALMLPVAYLGIDWYRMIGRRGAVINFPGSLS